MFTHLILLNLGQIESRLKNDQVESEPALNLPYTFKSRTNKKPARKRPSRIRAGQATPDLPWTFKSRTNKKGLGFGQVESEPTPDLPRTFEPEANKDQPENDQVESEPTLNLPYTFKSRANKKPTRKRPSRIRAG